MNKCKLLVISSSGFSHREGIGTLLLDNLSYFSDDKFKLSLIVSGDYSKEIVHKFVELGVYPIYLPDRKKDGIHYYSKLYQLLRRNEFDAIYVNGSSSLMAIDLTVARLCGIKQRVVHSHNTKTAHPLLHLVLKPLLIKLTTVPLACGQAAGHWLFGSHPFTVVNNGRDVNLYKFSASDRASMRRQLDLGSDEIAIGHVGNFTNQKNQKFLISAFQQYLSLNPFSHLFLVGTGETMQEIKNLVENKGLNSKVTFMGSIDNVPKLLQAMDIMLLPSVYEGLPLVTIEWQINGLPSIISSNITNECVFGEGVYRIPLSIDGRSWGYQILDVLKDESILQRSNRSFSNQKEAFHQRYDTKSSSMKLQSLILERA